VLLDYKCRKRRILACELGLLMWHLSIILFDEKTKTIITTAHAFVWMKNQSW